MTTKKKSKVSFDLPEEVQTTPQAGWVYRTGEPAPAPRRTQTKASGKKASVPRAVEPVPNAGAGSRPDASDGILNLAARTVSSSITAATNALLLGARILTAPLAMGMRMFGLFSRGQK